MRAIDKLPTAIKKEIRNTMEDMFERYHLSKYTLFQARESSVTASYEERPSGPTNVISDPTAQAAVHNADEPARRQAFCERIEQAVAQLPAEEREVITERYMNRDLPFDFTVYTQRLDPPISVGTYTKIRIRAFVLLALMLGIQVEGLQEVC
ncbi:ArpU family phage packaging/lysis transcriptional regulator [Paenibacillus woosongensis]|uniref:Transcriptional regulator n=1 Tax=Paenibacillus woosongensis TaxID=307580 RepID=A0A7X2YXC9_9BACL|nr:ArpU family phage packaging/lysis transcriptional regulator [Paenibacillus woosongensis]MUG43443.1 transcriptional regulator [Paenibacillus woosongensis]